MGAANLTLMSDSLRRRIIDLAAHDRVRSLIESSPGSRELLGRFIAGDTLYDTLEAVRDLRVTGRAATVCYLGPDGVDAEHRAETVRQYQALVQSAAKEGLTASGDLDVSLRLSALGVVGRVSDREAILEAARTIARSAANAGVTLTLDVEGPQTVAEMLRVHAELRADVPDVGITIASCLRRSEEDCRRLAAQGARVRLCKGAFSVSEVEGWRGADVDLAFVRCLRILLAGSGQVLIATHDPRLLEIAAALVRETGRDPATVEYQMYLGVRPLGQTSIADRGDRCRVYIPYGSAWYSYLMQRVADRPASAGFLARSVLTQR